MKQTILIDGETFEVDENALAKIKAVLQDDIRTNGVRDDIIELLRRACETSFVELLGEDKANLLGILLFIDQYEIYEGKEILEEMEECDFLFVYSDIGQQAYRILALILEGDEE